MYCPDCGCGGGLVLAEDANRGNSGVDQRVDRSMPDETAPAKIKIAMLASPISPRDGTVVWRLQADFNGQPDDSGRRVALDLAVRAQLPRWELRWRGPLAVLYPPRDPSIAMLVEFPPVDDAMVDRALAVIETRCHEPPDRSVICAALEAALPRARP